MIGFARRAALAALCYAGMSLAAHAQATTTPGDPPDAAIWQRDPGASSAAMIFVSSYTGSHSGTAQCQVVDFSNNATVIVPWTDGTWDSPSAGKMSCTLTVPQGSNASCWYALQTRDSAGATATGTHKWTVGVVIGLIGASIIEEMSFGFNSNPPAVNPCTSAYCQDFSNCSSGWSAPAGNGGIVLTNSLNLMLGVPIGLNPYVDNGTGTPDWDPAIGGSGALVIGFVNHMDGVHLAGNVEGVVVDMGDADCCVRGPTSKAAFETSMGNIIGYLYGAASHMTPPRSASQGAALVSITGNFAVDPTLLPVASDASVDAIRQGEFDVIAGGAPDAFGAAHWDNVRHDDAHYSNTNGVQYMHMGERIAQAMAHFAAPGSFPHGAAGPKIAGATYKSGDTVLKLQVQHDGGSALQACHGQFVTTCTGSGAGLCCFRVFVGGVQQTIAATSFVGGSEIDLTISGGTLGAPVTYDYFDGQQPSFGDTSVTPYDNQAIAGAPDAEGFPLQPTYGTLAATPLGTPRGGIFGGRRALSRQAMTGQN